MKRRKNESYSLVQEDVVSSESDEDMDLHAKKFFQDLEAIKAKQQAKSELKSAIEDKRDSKSDDKELKKLMKEKDKLERDAMVARMLQKDKEDLEKKKGGMSVVEDQTGDSKGMTLEDRMKYIPELRKISRQKYLELREE